MDSSDIWVAFGQRHSSLRSLLYRLCKSSLCSSVSVKVSHSSFLLCLSHSQKIKSWTYPKIYSTANTDNPISTNISPITISPVQIFSLLFRQRERFAFILLVNKPCRENDVMKRIASVSIQPYQIPISEKMPYNKTVFDKPLYHISIATLQSTNVR